MFLNLFHVIQGTVNSMIGVFSMIADFLFSLVQIALLFHMIRVCYLAS